MISDNDSIKCSTSSEQAHLMASNLVVPETTGTVGPATATTKTAAFFNNFVIEGVDQNGRTSLRQIVQSDGGGSSKAASGGPNIKFVRKSELSLDIYSNKSVISIKGESREVSIRYGASAQLAAQIAANMAFSMTVPPQKNNKILDFKVAGEQAPETLSVN